MVHEKKGHLSPGAVEKLKELCADASWEESKSIRRRMGKNLMENPSMYKTWKWHRIPRDIKGKIKEVSPKGIFDKTFLFFYRKYDSGIGLLDQMTFWGDKKVTTKFLAIALTDHNQIIIDGDLYVLSAGDSVKFSLSRVHEVPKVKTDALWAVWMLAE